MREHGFIQLSASSWGVPMIFAPKKDKGIQFCIAYHWLNKENDIGSTIKNSYPLPLPQEIMNRLGGGKVSKNIDLKLGICKCESMRRAHQKLHVKCVGDYLSSY